MICAAGAGTSMAQTIRFVYPTFTSLYSLSSMNPEQVEWTIYKPLLGDIARPKSWGFVSDISRYGAVILSRDYARSGYDRGHMCPSDDFSASLVLMRSTFSLSNVSPQVPTLNRGAWKKTENYCRAMAIRYDSVRVMVRPVFFFRDTLRIADGRICVPHAFLKVCTVARTDSILAYWLVSNGRL